MNMGKTTKLLRAARRGDTQTVQRLLASGASVNACNQHGWTALMRAAQNGHTECVRLLLQAGANPNTASSGGWTPLIYIAYDAAGDGAKRTIDAARLLIEFGADVNVVDTEGNTALAHAPKSSRNLITKLLKEHGAHR